MKAAADATDQGDDITIPTVLVSKRDGAWLRREIGTNEVTVMVCWDLPEEQKSLDVNWSLWAQTFDAEKRRLNFSVSCGFGNF